MVIKNNMLNSENTNKVNWKQFIHSPLKALPNYNKKFDATLRELSRHQSDYRQGQYGYEYATKRKNSDIAKREKRIDGDIYSSSMSDAFAISLVLSFIFIAISMVVIKLIGEVKEITVFLSFFCSIVAALLLSFFITTNSQKKEQEKRNTQQDFHNNNKINQEIKIIEESIVRYQNAAKALLKEGEYINIREHLNHYYYSQIPELNAGIQDILEQHYPQKAKHILSSDINETSPYIKTKHIEEISEYIQLIVSEKSRSIICDKIVATYNY